VPLVLLQPGDNTTRPPSADRFLPDKAIDLVDEAAARLKMEATSKPEALDEIERKVTPNSCDTEQQCFQQAAATDGHPLGLRTQ
jgi:ATP-dependent Clp protease ATP-binding subunit ClpB